MMTFGIRLGSLQISRNRCVNLKQRVGTNPKHSQTCGKIHCAILEAAMQVRVTHDTSFFERISILFFLEILDAAFFHHMHGTADLSSFEAKDDMSTLPCIRLPVFSIGFACESFCRTPRSAGLRQLR